MNIFKMYILERAEDIYKGDGLFPSFLFNLFDINMVAFSPPLT